MRAFSRSSIDKLVTCDKRLITLCERVVLLKDFSVVCGHRGEKEQNEAFNARKSKLRFPHSKHNATPSLAVDLLPYPLPTHPRALREDYYYLIGLMIGVGSSMGLNIRSGGDWNQNGITEDNSFDDLGHFEIVE